jgi:4-hydroxy-4-methyl-2-oxoglutarate aldolase
MENNLKVTQFSEENMVHVIKSIQRVKAELVNEFKKLTSATVHEAYGGRGALSCRIKPITPDMKVCGPVVTVKVPPCDNLILHKAIYVAQKGDVIVGDAGGFTESGAWGEIMAVAALQRGIGGLVFNGAVRDSQTIIELGFPVFSCGLSIKGTEKRSLGLINYPLILDNVIINPGDLILGDRDGLVVVKREEAEEVLQKSLAREEKEKLIKERLKQGESTLDIYGFGQVLKSVDLIEEGI